MSALPQVSDLVSTSTPEGVPYGVKILEVARQMARLFWQQKSLSATIAQELMKESFGDTSASGAWQWKDVFLPLTRTNII